jgi:4-hydroxy-tetrahydrodipicolinate reductase
VNVALFGQGGKVGSVLGPALVVAGHELVELDEADAIVDFTAPEAVVGHVTAALQAGVPCVVGTTGWDPETVDGLAHEQGLAVLYAPNFAIGAVLMMRLAEQAARYLPRAEIVELHAETKKDAPSGTAKATADRIGGAAIHSVRLPGLVAHQEVVFGGEGQTLSIRHDSTDRRSFMPWVLLAVRRVGELPDRFTVGLETLLSR